MKKAKMILAAIAVMAVAGGVYASKAKRATDHIYVRAAGTTTCTVTITTRTLAPNGAALGRTFATDVLGDACPVTVAYYTGA